MPVATPTPQIGASGSTLSLTFRDTGGAATTVAAVGASPTIRVNGGSPITLGPPLWANYFRSVVYFLATPIVNGDTVTFSDGFSGVPAIGPTYVNGEVPERTWVLFTGSGYRNNIHYLNGGHVGGNGTASATWNFTLPQLGSYSIAVTHITDPSYSTVSPFSIYDGATLLGTVTVNQQVAPSDFTDDGVAWKTLGTFTFSSINCSVRLTNNVPTGHVIADGVRVERVGGASFIAYGNDSAAGAYTTAAGGAPLLTNAAVDTSKIGSTIAVAAPPSGRTMKAGVNLTTPVDNYGPFNIYANAMRAFAWTGDATLTDANGYPLTTTSLTYGRVVVPVNAYDARNYPSGEPGTWTLKWDGSGLLSLASVTGAAVVSLASENLTGTTNNVRVYNVAKNAAVDSFGYDLVVYMDNSGSKTLQNWRLYPPGVATDGSQKFHPKVVEKLQGFTVIRTAGGIPASRSTVVDYSDFAHQAQASFGQPNERKRYFYITNITGYATSFWTSKYQHYLVTTAIPHGLKDGQPVQFDRVSAQAIVVTLNDDSTQDLWNAYLTARVVDATHFVVSFQDQTGNGNQAVKTPFTAADAYLRFDGYAGIPPEDAVDLCNETGCDLWFSVPPLASDACVTELFTMIATRLLSSLRVRVEYTNEHWNILQDFAGHWWCASRSYQLGLTSAGVSVPGQGVPYYCLRSKEVHALARAAFVAAGRPATDVIRVIAGWQSTPTHTTTIAEFCASQSPPIPFDEYALAPYQDILLAQEEDFDYESITTNQNSDVYELSMTSRAEDTAANVAAHRAILDANGYASVVFVCYEGGLGYGGLSANGVTNPLQSMAVAFHPNHKHCYWQYLSNLAAAGYTFYCHYAFHHPWVAESPEKRGANYGAYLGIAMQPGNGEANRSWLTGVPTTPPRLDIAESVVGYALNAWNATAATVVPTLRRVLRHHRMRLF